MPGRNTTQPTVNINIQPDPVTYQLEIETRVPISVTPLENIFMRRPNQTGQNQTGQQRSNVQQNQSGQQIQSGQIQAPQTNQTDQPNQAAPQNQTGQQNPAGQQNQANRRQVLLGKTFCYDGIVNYEIRHKF